MDLPVSTETLERIAFALERIAAALETTKVTEPHISEGTQSADVSVRPTAVNESSPAEAGSGVIDFLATRNIKIKTIKPPDKADGVIDSLSLFLGERYSGLKGLLSKIKRNMQNGGAITESIASLPQEDISSACQFCTRLYEVAFLEQYKYFRSPQYLIKAKTTTLPRAQMFFSGQWLERFTLQKLKSVHAQIQAECGDVVRFDYLINPQVIMPNGDDFEMDIVAIVGNMPIWIEAKSGDYQQHTQKYSQFARLLNINHDFSIMVLTDVTEESCAALSSLFSMTVVNLRTLEQTLIENLRASFAVNAQQVTPADHFVSASLRQNGG